MNANDKLALLGGEPVRKNSDFKTKPYLGELDINCIKEILSEGILSGFVGSDFGESPKLLRSSSFELRDYSAKQSSLGGKWVRNFEAICAEKLDCKYCVSVNSATSAIHSAILSLGIKPGSEIITTPYTFTACAAGILQANCVPIFADIDPLTFCLTVESVRSALSEHTKAILHVSWCGNAGEIDLLEKFCKEKDIFLIDDSSQSQFSKLNDRALGTFGDVGIYSFNQPKNVSTGEGGMIITDNEEIAYKCRLIRNHGENFIKEENTKKEMINMIGYNFRLTEISAAIGYNQVLNSNFLNQVRNKNFKLLLEGMNEFEKYFIPQKITNKETFFSYLAGFALNQNNISISRELLFKAMKAEGIPISKGIQRLLCDHPNIKSRIAWGEDHFPWSINNREVTILEIPNARHLFENTFFGFYQLGWPTSEDDVGTIIKAFRKILRNSDQLAMIGK
tara:strand:- start:6688 stop:8040 length:1353 start_codon:yes stop_codon:yes gene_type:complete